MKEFNHGAEMFCYEDNGMLGLRTRSITNAEAEGMPAFRLTAREAMLWVLGRVTLAVISRLQTADTIFWNNSDGNLVLEKLNPVDGEPPRHVMSENDMHNFVRLSLFPMHFHIVMDERLNPDRDELVSEESAAFCIAAAAISAMEADKFVVSDGHDDGGYDVPDMTFAALACMTGVLTPRSSIYLDTVEMQHTAEDGIIKLWSESRLYSYPDQKMCSSAESLRTHLTGWLLPCWLDSLPKPPKNRAKTWQTAASGMCAAILLAPKVPAVGETS